MPESLRAAITGRKTVWENGPFRVDEINVQHHVDAADPVEKTYVSFERGDAVAGLILNRNTRQVVLVEQFRPSIVSEGLENGRMLETAAGVVRHNETPEQCLQREIAEETGYQIQFDKETGRLRDVEFIADFFPSPGACSERIKLYYISVDDDTPSGEKAPPADEGEFVTNEPMSLEEFFHRLEAGRFIDAKIIIAGYWLKDRLRNRRIDWMLDTRPGQRQEFLVSKTKGKVIGYHTGDIAEITDVDIWVNSENTQFVMDRIGGDTVSARIRTLGARIEQGRLLDDTIQQALSEALVIGSGLALGQVLDTKAGMLEGSHNVKRIIHAATVQPVGGKHGVPELTTTIDAIRDCVRNALVRCDELSHAAFRWSPHKSVIFPLLGARHGGTGSDRLTSEAVAEEMIPLLIEYLQKHPESKLERIYLLAYTPSEIEICDRVMSRQHALQRTGKS